MLFGGLKKKYNWGDPETPVDGLPIPGAGLPGAGQGLPGPEAMNQPKKPSFFGQGGVGRGIAGTIGDVLLQNAGAAPVYAPAMQGQRQQKFAEAQYERKRTDQFQDQVALMKERQKYKEPDEFTQILQRAGIDPSSDEGRRFYRDLAEKKTADYMLVPDGQGGLVSIRRPSQETPTKPVGKLTPIGGPASAPGSFRP